MMNTIDVSDSVYERLSKLVTGFGDTPNNVIERLLDKTDNVSKKPSLSFYPEDESRFKELLLSNKKAEVCLYKADGEIEVIVWNALKFSESSNIKANIWSGYLRNWQEKGITKAEFTIYEKPIHHFREEEFYKTCEHLSPLINIPYRLLIDLEFDHSIESIDGENNLVVQFWSGQDLTLLENNEFFDSFTKQFIIPQHNLNYPF